MSFPDEYIPKGLRDQQMEKQKPSGFAVVRGLGIGIGGPWPLLQQALDFIPLEEETKGVYRIVDENDYIFYNWDHGKWVKS